MIEILLQDTELIKSLISDEYLTFAASGSPPGGSAVQQHMTAFSSGAWAAFRAIQTLVTVTDGVPYNNRATADPDHW